MSSRIKKTIRALVRWPARKTTLLFLLGMAAVLLARAGSDYTSSNTFCESCHVHPQATESWKLSVHRDTKSGVVVDCVDCHLPPGGTRYLVEKTRSSVRDAYGMLFKDVNAIDWEAKSRREQAVHFVFKESCVNCHQNLFPKELSKKGQDAHLHYDQHAEELRCINCHLDVGHDQPKKSGPERAPEEEVIFTQATTIDSFINFTETIPTTAVSFEMAAIPGGTFAIGSPDDEAFREPDEGPQRRVTLSPFWIGKTEVSWREYDAFCRKTGVQGRTEDQVAARTNGLDAITGPTPAYGNPDQGWGRGSRPAITMTYHAATRYCEWLSEMTGKKYRLPTEAEWEYAARGGMAGAYFFPGDPRDFSNKGFWNRIFTPDTGSISSHVVYAGNSGFRTRVPEALKPNPFGLLNTLGNVWEFCSDWYAAEAYSSYAAEITNPSGPPAGTEHVIRGGSYTSDAADIRLANREQTRHDAWLRTDPQIPKSLWWYSDKIDVGFRVVCESPP